ncbi:hypothetical protein, partial [Clostridioides difficile]|uniref:hypothetical protein n=1 Tax=Clostridioides difficile TaxID=1496 RepID=UPI002E8E081E
IASKKKIDGTPCAVKVARTVWSGGKLGDYLKELPIAIGISQSVFNCSAGIGRAGTKGNE